MKKITIIFLISFNLLSQELKILDILKSSAGKVPSKESLRLFDSEETGDGMDFSQIEKIFGPNEEGVYFLDVVSDYNGAERILLREGPGENEIMLSYYLKSMSAYSGYYKFNSLWNFNEKRPRYLAGKKPNFSACRWLPGSMKIESVNVEPNNCHEKGSAPKAYICSGSVIGCGFNFSDNNYVSRDVLCRAVDEGTCPVPQECLMDPGASVTKEGRDVKVHKEKSISTEQPTKKASQQ
jgi:hypothetical protein